jgi:N-acetyl-anhydromuramyl-L-alanine amidase AmpD
MSVECIQPWLAHRPRRGATVVDTIVLHATGKDDLRETLAELKEKGLSYHYIIDRAGLPHKCVPYSAVAFHAGNSYGPHEATRGTSREQDSNHNFVEMTSVNEYSIGLCLVNINDGLDACTQEQVDACGWLIKELRASLASLKFLTTHYWVSPGRANDPTGIDVERIAKKAGLEIWRP